MAIIDIKVPDIGDFAEVGVIELLVQPGDTVTVDQSLITVESDKASMEIPSSHAGVVKELKVKLGDKVAEGSVILTLEAAGEAAAAAPAAAPEVQAASAQPASVSAPNASQSQSAPAPAAPAPVASSYAGHVDLEADVVVIGGGPGGYSAAFRAADLGLKVVLVERYKTLGGAPEVSIDQLRAHKEKVIGKLTGGLGQMAKMRKVTIVRGVAAFVGSHHIEVQETTGEGKELAGSKKVVQFKNAIIAAGSEAVHLPFLPKDERIVDSTGALALKEVPKRMLILGGGIIGLEMGTVYSTLGARLDVVEMMDGLMQGADRDLVKVWQKMNAHRFDNIMVNTKTVAAEATPEGIKVSFEPAKNGVTVPEPQTYDLVLQAVGRTPNGKKIGAEAAGVSVTDRGFINVDIQMRTNVPHIFAIGDIVGQPMLAHKAVHEAHVAAEVIAGELQGNQELASAAFNARVIPSVAYTDPEVAWVGLTEDQAKAQGIKVKKGLFPWAASGRAIANGRDEGFTKLLFDEETHRILGGGIVGTHAGDMIGEIALAIEMGADSVDIGKTIHPHPTLGESIGMAAEVAHGSCTDVPPARR